MLDQKIVIGSGLLVLFGAVLLQPAALWLIVLSAGLFSLYVTRKKCSSPVNEHEVSELNHAIQKCAFQSNLLAMNAAVEALRTESERRELALRMERAARDTRTMVEQKIGQGGSQRLRLNTGAMDELARLLEESNLSLSSGPIPFDPQLMHRNVTRIEHLITAA